MKTHSSFAAASLGVLISGTAFVSLNPTPVYAWTDDTPSAASQCANADVNDAGDSIENCKVNNTSVPYVSVAGGPPTALTALPSTTGGVGCTVSAISNAAAGLGKITGLCPASNNVSQGTVWTSGAPNAPTQLMPATGVLGIIGAGVTTVPTDVNSANIVTGISTDGNGTDEPVVFSSGGAATPLTAPLLAVIANCASVSENDASPPAISGNCPAGASGGGKNVAVLWPTPTTAYVILPVPSGANYCYAGKTNLLGEVLGKCIYSNDTYRVVVWGPNGTGPTVMTTVNGGSSGRSAGADINDSGVIAVNFLAGGTQAGFAEPCFWNPAGGNTNGIAITLPGGADHGTVGAIGNNGKLVGNFETTTGDIHPMHIESGSTTAVDDGSPLNGGNAMATSASKSGTIEGAVAESPTEQAHGETQPVP